MIAELITKVLADRNAAHIEHWRTRSYAAHMALNDFYEGVIVALDAAVEAHIGCFGKPVKIMTADVDFSVEGLRETADWIEVNRKEIANDSDAVANLVDGVTAVYLAALYKLEQFT